MGGAVGVCAGVKIKGTADEDGGLLLPNASQGIADLKRAMGEGEGADRPIDRGPESAVFGDRNEGSPGARQGGNRLEFSQKGEEFGSIDRVDEVAMGRVWRVLKQLMGEANAQVSNRINVLGVGERKVIPVLGLKLSPATSPRIRPSSPASRPPTAMPDRVPARPADNRTSPTKAFSKPRSW